MQNGQNEEEKESERIEQETPYSLDNVLIDHNLAGRLLMACHLIEIILNLTIQTMELTSIND